jgi:hypothetical protein
VIITNSVVSGYDSALLAYGNADVELTGSSILGSGVGVAVQGSNSDRSSAVVRLANDDVAGNVTAFSANAGQVLSFGNNRVAGKKVELKDEIAYCDARPEEFPDLNDAIEALRVWDDRKCRVLEMKYFGGLGREEIAASLGMSLGTVKLDLSIAETFLRRELSRTQ